MAKKYKFKANDLVVYPGQGVGYVTEISTTPIGDEEILYYVVYLKDLDMTVLVPVEQCEKLGLRAIVSKDDIDGALKFLSEDCPDMPSDWKIRYQMNLDLFKSGTIMDTASVVRSLYHRGKAKELPIQERKLYESAYKIFQDEVAAALEIESVEAERMIHKALEPFPTAKISSILKSDLDDDLDDDVLFDDDIDDMDDVNIEADFDD